MGQRYPVPGMRPVSVEGDSFLVIALRGFGHELLVYEPSGGQPYFELLKLNPRDPYYATPVAGSDDWDEIVAELRRRVQ